jgi:beta-galactosidase
LEAEAVHDLGQVFLSGSRVGIMDRRATNFCVRLPSRTGPATLDLLVEAMGRINFGAEVRDRKGLLGPVRLRPGTGPAIELAGWRIFKLPLDDRMREHLRFGPSKLKEPAFWRTAIEVQRPLDTFLDMRGWTKGFVWVNGHNLGRYWNIGPQQTMYLPGPWLRKGRNTVVILDLIGPRDPTIAGLAEPVLNDLHPEPPQ